MSNATNTLLSHHADLITASAIAPEVPATWGYRPLGLKADLAHLRTFLESREPRIATQGKAKRPTAIAGGAAGREVGCDEQRTHIFKRPVLSGMWLGASGL